VGMGLGLVGLPMLALQFVLSARLRRLERPFGQDMVYGFHSAMGVLTVLLLLAHPVVLAAADGKWSLLWGAHVRWYIWVGRASLLLLAAHVLLAVFRAGRRLKHETWRAIHTALAVLILGGGLIHSWQAGDDLKNLPTQAVWLALVASAALAYLWHRGARPWRMRRRAYRVRDVRQEAEGVWTLTMDLPAGEATSAHLPGQYHYLTLHSAGMPAEEHPFTIASSPTQQGLIASTIKATGDFTAKIGGVRPGDAVLTHGPFGRFSYLHHPRAGDLVFIAGGVGITPLMSMLRHMRDTRADTRVLLLYANRTERDIVFRDELADMEAAEFPLLKVVHVLSKPDKTWTGDRGRIDREKVLHTCGGEVGGRSFYVCGPPAMIEGTTACLRDLGVPARRIHFERFSQ